ncbi:GH21627 [Drosophila grimshawi]|uniref:GH21627 n=1 Tax=Drosophila grimshawi TaxID=7222 RepID=B4J5C7_DROGR|nr:GH21627 [Drosophila grimshawi]
MDMALATEMEMEMDTDTDTDTDIDTDMVRTWGHAHGGRLLSLPTSGNGKWYFANNSSCHNNKNNKSNNEGSHNQRLSELSK